MTNSIDLIPPEYKAAIVRRRHVRWTGATLIGVCLASLALSVLIAGKAKALRTESEQVKSQQALVALYGEQLMSLEQRLAALDEEWVLLQGLRSGLAIEDVFVMVDRALPGGDVWFTDWSFRRAGVVVPEGSAGVETGYFIVVTDGASRNEAPAWHVETHMNIVGQANDHTALSKFVRGLYKNRQIESVKLNQTRTKAYANRSVVEFELAVVLYSEPAV